MPIRLLLVTVLLLTAAGLGYVALLAVQPRPGPAVTIAAPVAPAPTRVTLLVATRSLAGGTLLREADLTLREFPAGEVPSGALTRGEPDRAELIGGLLRRPLHAGNPVLQGDALPPHERGFLAAVLRPGRRAIAIGVDAVSGAAGLIWPGDQVDVLLTQELEARLAPAGRRMVAETLLTDVRIIAVDQQVAQGAGNAADPPVRQVARTVTLEVTAEQAERVAVALRLGHLSLTVRPMEVGEPGPPRAEVAVYGDDISPALRSVAPGAGSRMRLIQGPDEQEVTFR